jgi:hypothetical protein
LWSPDCSGSAYGNVATYGSGRNGWWGYAIQGRMVWMSDLPGGGATTGMHDNSYGWIWRWINESYFTVDRGYSIFAGSARAPIFYDSNDTGYYIDPNDAGFNAGRMRGAITFGPNPTWGAYIRVGGNGDSGDWAQVMTTNGNLHLDPRRGGYGTYLNWYAGGPVYVENQIQATIFYDRNDTTYYVDPNSYSNWQGLTTRAKAQIGLTGQSRSSTQYYNQRPNITGDSDYWTGSMGWGTVDMNTVADWGSGFIDSWSNPGNQPAGTSHWVGTQAFHYTNGSARYGWQMVGGPIAGLWFRNTWSSFSGWRKIAMYGLNEYSSDFWSTIMYDANNSGYYVDPDGLSRLNRVDPNEIYNYGWFRNHNSGQGLYNQATAMHWYSNSGYWKAAGGGYGYGGIVMFRNYESDLRGYTGYWDGSGFGMLNSSGNWQIRIEYGNANMELYRITYGNDFRAYIYYDRDDTSYYINPNTWSVTWGMGSFFFRNNYSVDVNHEFGLAFANDQSIAYRIFREGGGWSYPYPDMRIAFHTGIKFGANPSYEGMRFYTDYDMSSLVWQFNGGSNYSYQYRWNNLTDYHGIYSGINGAHFYPNPNSYGSWRVDGQRNGWGGLEFSYANTSLMMNTDTYGFHWNAVGWRFYNTGGSGYFPGNVVAYWSDRRLKENIKELNRGEGIELIYKLKPSRFNWRKEAPEVTGGVIAAGKEEVSVIAQETQEILPDAVVINMTAKKGVEIDGEVLNDYLTINYDKITPFLIQAIKDLKDEIDELREELRKERNRNGTH